MNPFNPPINLTTIGKLMSETIDTEKEKII